MKTSLLKTIDRQWVGRLLADPAWCLQQKYDGVRAVVRLQGGRVDARHRNGRPLDLGELAGILRAGPADYVLDAEFAWGILWVFDRLDEDCKPLPYCERLAKAAEIVAGIGSERVRLVRTWRSAAGKAGAFASAERARVEGVVLKHLDAAWTPGVNPAVGLRFKFRRRAECAVADLHPGGRRSVALQLWTPQRGILHAGSVAVPRDEDWEAIRTALRDGPAPVVEVEYLYATPAHRLYQPVLVRLRPDKSATPVTCSTRQLVYTHPGELDGPPLVDAEPKPLAMPAAAEPETASDGEPVAPSLAPTNRRRQPGGGLAWVLIAITVALFALVGCSRLLRSLPQGGSARTGRSAERGGGWSGDGAEC